MNLSQLDTARIDAWGQEVLKIEQTALKDCQEDWSVHFAPFVMDIVQLVEEGTGKVVVTGLGKSGHVARKMSSTLSSTGTPSVFLHPSEALHGDFGVLGPKDILLAIAYGGETIEVVQVAKFAREMGLKVCAMTGSLGSTLAKASHYCLNVKVAKEADPHHVAPTASTTVTMAMGDALAVAVLRARGFQKEDFARLHPGGSLGRKLRTVGDVMLKASPLIQLTLNDDFHRILEAVTVGNYGIAYVVDGSGQLQGALSDGDVRRALLKEGASALDMSAGQIMSKHPKTVEVDTLASEAVRTMGDLGISRLFVLDKSGSQVIGLVRLQDVLAQKVVP